MFPRRIPPFRLSRPSLPQASTDIYQILVIKASVQILDIKVKSGLSIATRSSASSVVELMDVSIRLSVEVGKVGSLPSRNSSQACYPAIEPQIII
jgi:hypothetical protein